MVESDGGLNGETRTPTAATSPANPTATASETEVATATASARPAPVQRVLSAGNSVPIPEGALLGVAASSDATVPMLLLRGGPPGGAPDDLFVGLNESVPQGGVYSWVSDEQGSEMYATLCVQAPCGFLPAGGPLAGPARMLRSIDRGVSWEALGEIPPAWIVIGISPDGPLLRLSRAGAGTNAIFCYGLYPAGEPLPRPLCQETVYAGQRPGIGVVYSFPAGPQMGWDGSELSVPDGYGLTSSNLQARLAEGALVLRQVEPGGSSSRYIVFNPGSGETISWLWSGTGYLGAVLATVRPSAVVAQVFQAGPGPVLGTAVIIDFANGEAHLLDAGRPLSPEAFIAGFVSAP